MNYNPYYFTPYMSSTSFKTGLFSRLFKGIGGIKWSGILGGTQKVLNIANQAIPMIKEVSPLMKNAKTMFKVMNEFKKVDTVTPKENNAQNDDNPNDEKIIKNERVFNNSGPTFFI